MRFYWGLYFGVWMEGELEEDGWNGEIVEDRGWEVEYGS